MSTPFPSVRDLIKLALKKNSAGITGSSVHALVPYHYFANEHCLAEPIYGWSTIYRELASMSAEGLLVERLGVSAPWGYSETFYSAK